MAMVANVSERAEKLINEIIERELAMFLAVRSRGRSICQERPSTFRSMRWMAHSILPHAALVSYLGDLKQAEVDERNLLEEKYARMEDLIEPLNDNPKIQEIVWIQDQWMKDFAQRYPHIVKGGGPYFRIYLASELETYSDGTLELYHAAVMKAADAKENLAEQGYRNLFCKLGYDSLPATKP